MRVVGIIQAVTMSKFKYRLISYCIMEKTEKLIKEFFPNMHSKTIGGIVTIVSIATYVLCESGMI